MQFIIARKMPVKPALKQKKPAIGMQNKQEIVINCAVVAIFPADCSFVHHNTANFIQVNSILVLLGFCKSRVNDPLPEVISQRGEKRKMTRAILSRFLSKGM